MPKLVEQFKSQGKNFTFSFYFPKSDWRQGVFTVDGYDLQKYSTSDELVWVDLTTDLDYWTTEASSIKMGGKSLPGPAGKKQLAEFDSGTSFSLIPENQLQAIVDTLLSYGAKDMGEI